MADISVIIPTRRRPESLAVTLQSLAAADRSGIAVEIIVVENDGERRSECTCQQYATLLELRYFLEPRLGKSYALNRALDEGISGRVIAVLDDDISVDSKWFRGVAAITQRWPGKGFYTGRSLVQWPEVTVPEWCKTGSLQGWAYSVLDQGSEDYEMPDHMWASGNCFWFKKEILSTGRRFPNPSGLQMESEPQFMLELTEAEMGGVAGPDAIVWHRVQKELLDVETLTGRAARAGHAFAEVRLRPFRKSNQKARQFRDHPFLARAYCLWHLLKSYITWWWVRAVGSTGQIGHGIHLQFLIAYYTELLRVAGQMPDYRVRLDRATFHLLKRQK